MINLGLYILQSGTPIADGSVQQQGNFLGDLLNWVSSSNAAGVSFLLNVISFLLAVAGFLLYFQQKREYRLLSGILEEYGLQQRIKEATDTAKSERSKLDEEISRRRDEIEEAKRDLKERLPSEARKAYYENAIPALQKQIYDLEKQLESMTKELMAYESAPSASSPHIKEIMSEEIRKHLSIQRDMERVQTLLTILTAFAAAVGALLPSPLNFWIAIPLGILILKQVYRYWKLYHVYYNRSSKRFL